MESIGHKTAKETLATWLKEEYPKRYVWLEYPFYWQEDWTQIYSTTFISDGTSLPPYGLYFDEHCKNLVDLSVADEDFTICDYRKERYCACLACNKPYPQFIADVVVGEKGYITEIWEVVNKSDLTDEKRKFYKQLTGYNIRFFTIPDLRIMRQFETPNLNIFRGDHSG